MNIPNMHCWLLFCSLTDERTKVTLSAHNLPFSRANKIEDKETLESIEQPNITSVFVTYMASKDT